MKKDTIINILIVVAILNAVIVVFFFVRNAIQMNDYKINSPEWSLRHGNMFLYIAWLYCSHIPLAVAGFVNTSRKLPSSKKGIRQDIYEYNKATNQYERTSSKFIPSEPK